MQTGFWLGEVLSAKWTAVMLAAKVDTLDDKYKLLRRIGEGGFGEVWLARDTVLGNRQVAIKFLKESTPAQEQSFLAEMRALAGLNHPGIVTFFHHFRHEQRLALVMEYCADGIALTATSASFATSCG